MGARESLPIWKRQPAFGSFTNVSFRSATLPTPPLLPENAPPEIRGFVGVALKEAGSGVLDCSIRV